MKEKEEKKGLLDKIKYLIFDEVYVSNINLKEEKEFIIDNKIYEIKEKKKLTDKDYEKIDEYNMYLEKEKIENRKKYNRQIKYMYILLATLILLFILACYKNNIVSRTSICDFRSFFAFITVPFEFGKIWIDFTDIIMIIVTIICIFDIRNYRRNLISDTVIINKYLIYELYLVNLINVVILGLTYHYREIFVISEFVSKGILLIISIIILIVFSNTNTKLLNKLADSSKGVV